ncbi:unnamed protein product [Rotaria sordida]|uniref:Uncharacterized protein n=1 Tax=Rotaria sordida TaxID=392033 RepID=A0A814GKF8_9BILA|nr:unnamed protein product [Rotaria sordida]CAF1100775.1 unnamed protein product [Rotaria sordida]
MFSTDLTVQCSSETKEIFQCEHPSISIFNGQYVNLSEIEHELERLPCIRKVWVTIISNNNQDFIGAVYQVCDDAAAFVSISWFERLVTFAKLCLPSRLIPSLWARVESNIDDRNTLREILHTADKIHKNDHHDETSLSFEQKIQRLVQNTLNLDHLPDLSEDFFPERRKDTISSHRLVRALQIERSDYTHTNLFEHRTLQDVIHYLQQSPTRKD